MFFSKFKRWFKRDYIEQKPLVKENQLLVNLMVGQYIISVLLEMKDARFVFMRQIKKHFNEEMGYGYGRGVIPYKFYYDDQYNILSIRTSPMMTNHEHQAILNALLSALPSTEGKLLFDTFSEVERRIDIGLLDYSRYADQLAYYQSTQINFTDDAGVVIVKEDYSYHGNIVNIPISLRMLAYLAIDRSISHDLSDTNVITIPYAYHDALAEYWLSKDGMITDLMGISRRAHHGGQGNDLSHVKPVLKQLSGGLFVCSNYYGIQPRPVLGIPDLQPTRCDISIKEPVMQRV